MCVQKGGTERLKNRRRCASQPRTTSRENASTQWCARMTLALRQIALCPHCWLFAAAVQMPPKRWLVVTMPIMPIMPQQLLQRLTWQGGQLGVLQDAQALRFTWRNQTQIAFGPILSRTTTKSRTRELCVTLSSLSRLLIPICTPAVPPKKQDNYDHGSW